ncbi:Kef-type K+ transport system membrane component KefB [Streptomyces aurantiacus]|uniref:cation:proton antiporter n=1 Tax=Streptomyces aurantiacus TaxID=47760 RepID=UPI00278EB9B1|nr:cation:proton antiporter [Streptomyces aurantiacus]MDQ0771935.1 Kef-type K+ transport system membrane component KefB [Streptomyces aurantiacus]
MSVAATVVAPLSSHTLMVLLLQVGVLLLTALLLGRLAQRLGMPAIVGELSAGVLLGPSLLAAVAPGPGHWIFPQNAESMHLLDAVGQLGVILLVGFTGIHVDLKLVRRQGTRAAGVSAAGLLLPLGLGVGVGFLLPTSLRAPGADPTVFALFVGVAMCVSAIPVIARTLIDMKLIHRDVGQMILVAGTVDDTVGWVLLSLVASMATAGLVAGQVLLTLGKVALLLLFTMTLGRWLVGAAMRAAARRDVAGLPVITAVVLMTLSAAGSQSLGLEAVFGAFLCGVLIGDAKNFDTSALAPLNTTVMGVLAPLFFATAGLRMDLTALGDPRIALWGFAVFAVAVLGKFLGAFVGGLTSRMNRWESIALGAGMNARGVIEVIIALAGVRLGLLSVEMFSIVVLVAVLTSLMAPPLLRMAMNRVEQTAEEDLRRHRVLAVEHRVPSSSADPVGRTSMTISDTGKDPR